MWESESNKLKNETRPRFGASLFLCNHPGCEKAEPLIEVRVSGANNEQEEWHDVVAGWQILFILNANSDRLVGLLGPS